MPVAKLGLVKVSKLHPLGVPQGPQLDEVRELPKNQGKPLFSVQAQHTEEGSLIEPGKKENGLFKVLLKSYLSCWLEEQIVKLAGRLLFCTFAKDGGWEVNMGESLNEKTKKQLVDGIATFKSQAARNRYIFFLWKKTSFTDMSSYLKKTDNYS